MAARKKNLTDADYVRLGDFRYALRRFLEFSEKEAAKEGLTPQQHQALLVIRASPEGAANIGRLAERLRIRHNTAVELAKRLEFGGLVTREASEEDRRSVVLSLTDDGARRLEVLTHVHRNELKQLSPEILGLFQSMEGDLQG
ncbi:MAG: MarR family transcriptional regulator [Verrucomicrobiaceae bacterium]|nr:MAG: MarR family transcriptional regulator [Verrucomicrobiaceae bacterium]